MLIAIMGPTAGGKSALALFLARRFNGEIVAADSMQLYAALPIGTAQPTAAEQAAIPHHLYGTLPLAERMDVHRYAAMADAAMAEITARGRLPIVVGGTGFYLKALFYGLDPLPGDPTLRCELDREYDSEAGFEPLRRRLAELDPAALARWRDCRRKLIRALEVRLLAGRSILELQQGPQPLRRPVVALSLQWPPELLRERIAQRTDAMLAAGWLDEARSALASGLLASPTAHQAIGYRAIGEHLAGRLDDAAMRQRIIVETGQLARRQRTWFRHQHPEAIPVPMPESAERIAELVEKHLPSG